MVAKRSLVSAPLWLVGLLGVVVTALGVIVQAGASERIVAMFAGTVSAVGGAVIGAAISLYFAAGEGRDTLRSVREILAESSKRSLTSPEADLAKLRKVWHVYHKTSLRDEIVWRYTRYPFDLDRAIGSLSAYVVEPELGREPPYHVEAGIRAERMIYIETATGGDEPPIIGVVPWFSGSYRTSYAGLRIFHAWDGFPMVSKCLWSEQELARTQGSTVEREDWPELEALWQSGFSHTIELADLSPVKPKSTRDASWDGRTDQPAVICQSCLDGSGGPLDFACPN